MPQYVNPGVAAAAGIDQFMVDRAARQRQAMLDQIMVGREERLKTADEQDAEIRRLKIASDHHAAEAAAGIKEAEAFQKHIKDTYIAGDVIDPADLAKADKLGIDLPRQMPPATAAAPAASAERGMGMGPFAGMQGAAPPPVAPGPAVAPQAVFSGYAPERAEAQKQSKIDALVARAKTTKPGTPEWDQLAAEFAANKVTVPAATMRPDSTVVAPRTLIVSPDKKTLTERLPDGTMRPFVGSPLKTDIMLDAPQPKDPKDTSGADLAREDRQTRAVDQERDRRVASIEKISTPIETQASEAQKVDSLLAMNNPKADALIAPLMIKTGVVGGGGTAGLRMTQNEINSELGGSRTAWDSLRVKMAHWQPVSQDPSDPSELIFGPGEREAFAKVARLLRKDAQKRLTKIYEAQDQLIGAKTVEDVNKLHLGLKKDLYLEDATPEAPSAPDAVAGHFDPKTRKFIPAPR